MQGATKIIGSYRQPLRLHREALKGHTLWMMLVPLTMLVGGCDRTNLVAVQNFANVSQQATAQFPELAADIYGSCVRAAQFESELPTQQKVQQRCGQFKQLAPALIATNKVLEEFLFALGTLAADQTVAYGPALAGLAQSVQANTSFQPAQVKAVNGILGFLLEAQAGRYRQQQVQAAIATTNTDLNVLISALKAIIGQDYSRLLLIEEQTMAAYYRSTISTGKEQPLLVAVIKNQWHDQRTTLAQKKAAVAVYIEILDQIAAAHQQLYNDRGRLSSQEMIQGIVQYARTLQPLMKNLVKAF